MRIMKEKKPKFNIGQRAVLVTVNDDSLRNYELGTITSVNKINHYDPYFCNNIIEYEYEIKLDSGESVTPDFFEYKSRVMTIEQAREEIAKSITDAKQTVNDLLDYIKYLETNNELLEQKNNEFEKGITPNI